MARPQKAGGKRSAAKTRKASPVGGRQPTRAKRRVSPASTRTKHIEELKEAREQQAATAEILRVIASSPSDTAPVFKAIANSANRLIGGFSTAVYRVIDDVVHLVAFTPTTPEADEALKTIFPLHRSQVPSLTMVQNGQTAQIADAERADTQSRRIAHARGWRSVTFTPLMNHGAFIGFIACTRREVGVLADHHVQLLRTFADQAVIAIENARLFGEVKARTEDLRESLEYQIATSEVLGIISRSPTDVQPVFEAIAASALRLCGAKWSVVTRFDGEQLHLAALHNLSDPEGVDAIRRIFPRPLSRGGPTDRAILTGTVINLPDVLKDPEYIYQSISKAAGYRSHLAVPTIRDGNAIGAITVAGEHPAAFTERHVNLLKAFADQAVIAIENVRLFEEVRARTDDLAESLQQQTATADVLKVISRSTFNLQTVLDTLVESATRLCEADHAWLFQRDGDLLRFKSSFGHGTATHERIRELFLRREVPIDRGSITGRSAFEGRVVHVADVLEDREYTWSEAQKIGGYRAALGAPLLRDGKVVGVIFVAKTKPDPFSGKQIDLVTTFADQAVIAIENVRLFEDLRARTRDLAESLQQQTATSEVLGAISSSLEQLEPLFQKILENAVRVCGAKFGTMNLYDGERYDTVAGYNLPRDYAETQLNKPFVPHPNSGLGTVAATHRPVHIEDIRTQQPYLEGHPAVVALSDMAGARTLAIVPMLKDDKLVGTLAIYRQDVSPFNEKQITLLSNFAKQAVIAIENNRLLKELRESLQQQTATADVLKTISRSTFDLQAVLHTLVESAARLCDADKATITRQRGHEFFRAESFGFSDEFMDYVRTIPVKPDRGSAIGRALLEGIVVHIPDVTVDPDYTFTQGQKLGDFRTILGVPMLREGVPIGVIALTRSEALPFSDKQIELATTFADQAAIAMENVRLFDEVQAKTQDLSEALTYQTGSANILKVIASSPADINPVLQAIVESACELCDAYDAIVRLKVGDSLHSGAHHGEIPISTDRWPINRSSASGCAILDKRAIHVRDMQSGEGDEFPESQERARRLGHRTILSVPLVREGESIGVIIIRRPEVNPFTDGQIELLQTFADQAVIAIENARLFNETKEALEQQTATSKVLEIISSSPGELEPVFQAMLANATRLCEAKYSVMWLREGNAFRSAAIHGALPAAYIEHLRSGALVDPTPGSPLALVTQTQEAVQIPDLRESRTYLDGEPLPVSAVEVAGIRTLLLVPMFKEVDLVGAIAIYRQEVRTFTDRQIDLVTNFAKQAVIAIENTRLLKELRERTDDLTRSLDDLRAAQDRLVQTEKLASLGQLTAGIAHEIKNPLNFVNNFSALSAELTGELNDILKSAALTEKVREEVDELTRLLKDNLEKVVQHGKRADSIVKNMLLHSREGSGELRTANINALVEESLSLAYHGARAEKPGFNITLRHDLDPDAGELDIYPQEITRALLNLISNGFYAATKRKTEAGDETFEAVLSAVTRNLGKKVEIRIRDNGTGIPADVKEKMFNPFFTTKPAGEGTGLGLSMSHDIIVKQHGGSIDVETEPGAFTEFIITLPRKAILLRAGGTN